MSNQSKFRRRLERTETYLRDTLLPFWIERAPDPPHGFLSHFNRHGRPTGATGKTFLMQIRLVYTFAHAARAGYHRDRCLELARAGADFVLDHYWDDEHGGWYWIADREGNPTVTNKIGYGQCFAMYALGEYWLATGDPRGREAMERTFAIVSEKMADPVHGGYFEIMERDWRPTPGDRSGGDRKSLDVHMHMMEALTSVYEVTGDPEHRRSLEDVIAILLDKMLDPEQGTGLMQFAPDFTPLPAIRFEGVAWGRDEDPEEDDAFPLDTTSYGHNVELAWLLLRAADTLGIERRRHADVVARICDHCLAFGLDEEHGGVYVDGPAAKPTTNRKKQFWQQAEVQIGMLDAYSLLGDEKYWHAYENVDDFVFDHMIAWDGGGEWYGLCERDGTPLWTDLATDYKISYHTVRAMVGVTQRLRGLA